MKIPEINITLEEIRVEAETRQLRAKWSIDTSKERLPRKIKKRYRKLFGETVYNEILDHIRMINRFRKGF